MCDGPFGMNKVFSGFGHNSTDTPVRVAEPPVNYKGLASSGGQNEICLLVPYLCLGDREYSMEHNETCFTIFEVKCIFYGFYMLGLCVCAVITRHSARTSKPSDMHRLLSGFGYNSMDTQPK